MFQTKITQTIYSPHITGYCRATAIMQFREDKANRYQKSEKSISGGLLYTLKFNLKLYTTRVTGGFCAVLCELPRADTSHQHWECSERRSGKIWRLQHTNSYTQIWPCLKTLLALACSSLCILCIHLVQYNTALRAPEGEASSQLGVVTSTTATPNFIGWVRGATDLNLSIHRGQWNKAFPPHKT